MRLFSHSENMSVTFESKKLAPAVPGHAWLYNGVIDLQYNSLKKVLITTYSSITYKFKIYTG